MVSYAIKPLKTIQPVHLKLCWDFSIDGELVGKYALEHQSMSVLLSQYTPQLYLLNCESECNVEIFEMDDILKAKL